MLNKRDPRRKNVTTEATRQQASFQQGVYDMSKPAYAAQLLANQVANLKVCKSIKTIILDIKESERFPCIDDIFVRKSLNFSHFQ